MVFVLVPMILTTVWASLHFNVNVLFFWESITNEKRFPRILEPGTFIFFLWTYDSNALTKITNLLCCNLFRSIPTSTGYHILRGAAPKNGRTFCLDKCCSCYIAIEMFVTPAVFFIASIWKLVDQDFYSQFPMSLDWRFEYAILVPIQNSNSQ